MIDDAAIPVIHVITYSRTLRAVLTIVPSSQPSDNAATRDSAIVNVLKHIFIKPTLNFPENTAEETRTNYDIAKDSYLATWATSTVSHLESYDKLIESIGLYSLRANRPVPRMTLSFHIRSKTDATLEALIGQESAPKPPPSPERPHVQEQILSTFRVPPPLWNATRIRTDSQKLITIQLYSDWMTPSVRMGPDHMFTRNK
uniref:Uncharacterized protein n=1 Tax=Timema poppense TaxID=170557 RepID=A0A7R9DL22_TIMPO|nr:unnamed protein product [Timema poppensis]